MKTKTHPTQQMTAMVTNLVIDVVSPSARLSGLLAWYVTRRSRPTVRQVIRVLMREGVA